MKIALIGTHSTGKTTIGKHIALALSQQGHEVNYLPELARMCPMPINESTTFAAQHWILKNQIEKEGDMYKDGEILLCDRSTLDNFAYMQRAVEERDTPRDVSTHEKTAAEHMRTYTHIFKTQKLDLGAKRDGKRSTDESFREDIDSRITHMLKKHDIAHHLLPKTLDYKKHVEFILDKIHEWEAHLPQLALEQTAV